MTYPNAPCADQQGMFNGHRCTYYAGWILGKDNKVVELDEPKCCRGENVCPQGYEEGKPLA